MKKLIRLTNIAAVLAVLAIVGGFLYFYISPPVLFKKQALQSEAVPPAGSRILVFAPHSDDETLGTGMLIHRALKNGSKVKVVLITNGDGFRLAVDEDFITLHPSNREFRQFGNQRQLESIAALKRLGLERRDIIFLGYPDGGISHLWNQHWDLDKPYFSRYTRTDKSPYKDSYDKKVVYTGVSILSDIRKVIRENRPDYIYYPHPNDRHPDHWAVHAFVKYVLEEQKINDVRERLYLVHRGNWPKPKLAQPKRRLLPPSQLEGTGTLWREFPTQPGESQLKQQVILLYRTQVRAMKSFLLAFVRSSELFGEYPDFRPDSANKNSGTGSDLAISDPRGDFITGDLDKSADITGVYCFRNGDKWVFEIATGEPVSKSNTYRLHARLFPDKGEIRRFDLDYSGGTVKLEKTARNSLTTVPGIKIGESDGRLQISIPINSLDGLSAVFVSADCSIGKFPTDKTAWRMIRL